MKSMKHNYLVKILGAALLLVSSVVSAIDLDSAKQQGLVGEKDNGYLGIVVERNDVQQLVNYINNKRKDIYRDLANKNNLTLEQVEKLAAQKAYDKTLSGNYLWVNGEWQKK